MKLSNDISQEELAVFLEETDEELKLLDEDLILMEKSGVKPEIIQEIFRAAHTLKGSSAMLGYEPMSKVAHMMEAIFDLLRSGKAKVSTPMINALLSGLDMLKLLREKLVSSDDNEEVDIAPVMKQLEQHTGKSAPSTSSVDSNPKAVSQDTQRLINEAQEKGVASFNISITLDKNSSWRSVRHFQLFTELSNLGEVISCSPSKDEIENGKVEATLQAVLASSQDAAAIKTAIGSVADVTAFEVEVCKSEDLGQATQAVNKPAAETGTAAKKAAQTGETVRVDVKLLDNLMNLVGEMVIDRNRIKQISRKLEIKYEDDEIIETLGDTSTHMVKLVSDLQENILRARMLNIGTILNGFPRLVRDLAQKAGKKIDFIIEGQETELDRSIIEQIRDPLLHLIRNSVDHGIESPAKRKAAGKSETGTIRLSAYHEQSHIVVSISDDGGGIDTEKVKKASVAKGFLSAEAATRLTVAEAHNLIFMNGLSTAEKVTEVSGRGVGMDVVKTNVSNVGGSIFIESKLGQGTSIKIRLPLTLATIDGILVSCGGLIYVLPISAIVEILKLGKDQIQGVLGKEVIRLRENVIPLIRLNQKFAADLTGEHADQFINVVVIKVGDKLSGLIVDAVLEPQESVVKPLGKFIGSLKGISGATIMGDGQVALILDTATLVKEN
jgi:two-component system, chemotaxis family, sensor kinase CheA